MKEMKNREKREREKNMRERMIIEKERKTKPFLLEMNLQFVF